MNPYFLAMIIVYAIILGTSLYRDGDVYKHSFGETLFKVAFIFTMTWFAIRWEQNHAKEIYLEKPTPALSHPPLLENPSIHSTLMENPWSLFYLASD